MATRAHTTHSARRGVLAGLLALPVGASAAASADPVFALLSEERAAYARFLSAPHDDEIANPLFKAWVRSRESVYLAQPQTTMGLLAILDTFIEHEREFLDEPLDLYLSAIIENAKAMLATPSSRLHT